MSEADRWTERFATPDYRFGTEPNAFLKRQKPRLPTSGRALSLADGEGRNGVWLAEQGLDVLAVDVATTGLAKAEALAAKRGVTLTTQQADITSWSGPEAEAFDVAVLIFAQFLSPDDRTKVFADLRRALKPGGLLLIEGYRPEQIPYGTGGPRIVENLYTRSLLEAAFADFSHVTIDAYDAVIEEGTGHVGMSALIDLVAIK